MADYIKDIPNGQMMIRDTGGWVEFWFKTGASTWHNDQWWHIFYDGGWHDMKVAIPRGGNWTKIHSTFLTARQNVIFRIDGAGLGWGTTDHSAFIERARQPDQPAAPYFGAVTETSIHVGFDYPYDGGLPILEAQIGMAGPGYSGGWQPGNNRVFSGLYPGTEYLFFGRVRNAVGWSYAGHQSRMRTLRVPDAPNPVTYSEISPTSVKASFVFAAWDGGTPIREYQIAYGLDPNSPTVFVSGYQVAPSGLQAGKRYYFWGRARNDIGWGPWSARSEVRLLAGAYVKVAGEWKRAIPWVKVGGVWKIGKAHIPVSGTWRVPSS